MIRGIGIDVVEVDRIREAMKRDRFLHRILTLRERSFGNSAAYVAGRWAAKEAIAKAVGKNLGWQNVEVVPDSSGKPIVELAFVATDMKIHLSISHEKGIAAAVAILEAAS
jgi:holo-[acyl-carrier protein] synthase